MIGIIRKRKTGTVRLADCPEFRARYSVERAKSSKSSGDQTSTSKTRIVWNFDEDKLKKLFGGKVPSVSDGEEAVMPTDIEASMVASSWSSKIDGSKSLGSSKWGYDLSEKPRTSTGEERMRSKKVSPRKRKPSAGRRSPPSTRTAQAKSTPTSCALCSR